jgi:hypothetical protein
MAGFISAGLRSQKQLKQQLKQLADRLETISAWDYGKSICRNKHVDRQSFHCKIPDCAAIAGNEGIAVRHFIVQDTAV